MEEREKNGEEELSPADQLLEKAARSMTGTPPLEGGPPVCGVDLGTASIILAAVDSAGEPIACEMQPCRVAQDGLVVDYTGAIAITRRLKEKLESRLGRRIIDAAIAVPPGTNKANTGTHRHVTMGAGFEVLAVADEPVAANMVLGIQNGVVVDIGGGTTGLSIFREGEVIYSADEPTGGTHVSLVLQGRYGFNYEQAEAYKMDPANVRDVAGAVLPVIEKMATIVERHIKGHEVSEAWLVGGTSCLPGIERVFSRILGIPSYKPHHPMLVTPLGIAYCGLEARKRMAPQKEPEGLR
ncbi:MAG: ethanolamine utilization protein EutJ [Treponema sp.]|jgi:ethanolamine utilization protein EutJ|nr:ethanolamine utilization protein EutJ [Treponema sp.]